MDSKTIHNEIRNYDSNIRVNSEIQNRIFEVEQLSESVSSQRNKDENQVNKLKFEIAEKLVRQQILESTTGGARSSYSAAQELEKLKSQISKPLSNLQELELKQSILLDDLLKVVQRELPELQNRLNAYTPEDHQYSKSELSTGLAIRMDIETGNSYETAFSNQCHNADSAQRELYRQMTA